MCAFCLSALRRGAAQELLEFLVFTYRVQTEARQLFIMIARHDFSAIRKFIFAGDRYRSNQAVLFEEEKAALRVRECRQAVERPGGSASVFEPSCISSSCCISASA